MQLLSRVVTFTLSMTLLLPVGALPVRAADNDNPFAGATFYVDPKSNAVKQIAAWQTTRPADAEALMAIASQPAARWLGAWYSDIRAAADRYVTRLEKVGALPVFVLYNIPEKSCRNAVDAAAAAEYIAWVQRVAEGIGDRKAVVILEPDALAKNCADGQRTTMLASAVSVLKVQPHIAVYIDAGHSNWVKASSMATRLQAAGIADADGFSLNVANFHTTADNIAYGEALAQLVGGKHFVIDTGRNGNGSNGEWCNPAGRRIGANPTTNTGHALVDAFLWIKPPGQSDGTCNGGPVAGKWWADYALGLVRN